MGPPSHALSVGSAGEAGGSGSPAPTSFPALPRCPGAPGPRPATASYRPSRLPSRRRRTAVRIGADRQPNCTASSIEGLANDPHSGELPDPCGALSALTASPKRCLILPILLDAYALRADCRWRSRPLAPPHPCEVEHALPAGAARGKANNLLLIPLAFGVLHLAMREAPDRCMSMWLELGLLASLWAIVNFTAVNLYLKWAGGGN